MPQIIKMIEQHIRLIPTEVRRKLKERGVIRAALYLALLPRDILQKYARSVKNNRGAAVSDAFDIEHSVETSVRVHVTDLRIKSRNWIHAEPYFATPWGLLTEALAPAISRLEGLTFIDLGSGKGRVVLMASEFPFRKIIGVEFSPELDAAARRNVEAYRSGTQRCRNIALSCMDFTKFQFPVEPLIVFLYNPARERVIRTVAQNLMRSLREHPREIWIVYVTPYEIFDAETALEKVKTGTFADHPYSVYRARDGMLNKLPPQY
jgi:hypothetical protein